MTCKAIGIDLGTTYSCVGVYKNGKVEILANEYNERTTPSIVAFTDTERLVGESAKNQANRNPENTIFDVKRLIGRQFNDREVQSDIMLFPFTVKEKKSQPVIKAKFKNMNQEYTPEEISAIVLRKMKTMAEQYLGHDVTDAVITVPAYFNDGQRQATKDAATIAGLIDSTVQIINEPTAAAIAYGLENNIVGGKNILIFDLGGGTFDVSIVTVSEGPKFEVKATSGDSHLGGEDFDQRLLKYCATEFERIHNENISRNPRALRKLRDACEKAKRTLSNSTEVDIEIDSLFLGIDFKIEITRARFEDMCMDLFEKTIETVQNAIKDSKISKSSIDDVVLVGGSTRIPKVQEILKKYFNGINLKYSINPDEAVAYGATIKAAQKFGVVETSIRELQLLDVTPLSLGTDTIGDVMSNVIERNTTIPVKQTKRYNTVNPGQTKSRIQVYEGERPKASENHKLGEFLLSGIIPENNGPHDVTFEVDLDGILHVTAVAINNGVKNSIEIKYDKGRLSQAEIQRMVQESEQCEQESEVLLRRSEALGNLESFALSVLEKIEQHGSRIPTNDVKKAKDVCSKAMKWMEEHDSSSVQEIESQLTTLKTICDPLLERMNRRVD